MWLFALQVVVATALQVHDLHDGVPCSPHLPGNHIIQLPEIQRQFVLVVPQEYAPRHSFGVPLVLAFHGFGDSPWYTNLLFDFSQHINRYGWLGILPFGLNATSDNGLDGVGACCPKDCQGECCMNTPSLRPRGPTACGWRDYKEEMKFVEAILEWTNQNSCTDPHKVFSMGFSQGGMFVNYLACHASHLIRAFAPASGDTIFSDDCPISQPISYVSICGTNDDRSFCQLGVERTAAMLSAKNNCSGGGLDDAAVKYARSATTSCKLWDTCPGQHFVEVCMVEGLAHDVSGHLRPDNTSYLRPGADLDFAEYAFQKFSLHANGSMLFWGKPTPEELRYKASMFPFPHQEDHPYMRNGSLHPTSSV